MAVNLGLIASQISGHLLGPASFESIATYTLGSESDSVTFNSIPSTYKHLQVRCFIKAGLGNNDVMMNFNADLGNNYSYHTLFGSGTATAADATTNTNVIYVARNWNVANTGCVAIVDVLDYKDTNKYKSARILTGWDENASRPGYRWLGLYSGSWRNTAAISSLKISAAGGYTMGANTKIALYGIKG